METVAEIAQDASAVSITVTHDLAHTSDADRAAARALADRLELALSEDDALEPLARALQIPGVLVERWILQTQRLLRALDAIRTDEGRSILAERLAVLAWCWGDVPAEWPREALDEALSEWEVEERLVLGVEPFGARHLVPARSL